MHGHSHCPTLCSLLPSHRPALSLPPALLCSLLPSLSSTILPYTSGICPCPCNLSYLKGATSPRCWEGRRKNNTSTMVRWTSTVQMKHCTQGINVPITRTQATHLHCGKNLQEQIKLWFTACFGDICPHSPYL